MESMIISAIASAVPFSMLAVGGRTDSQGRGCTCCRFSLRDAAEDYICFFSHRIHVFCCCNFVFDIFPLPLIPSRELS